ncbi:MAG: hypothetical protein ACOCWJ_01275 [Verrucomicrobiota bacterium]
MLNFPLNIVRNCVPVTCILLPLLLLCGCGNSEEIQYDNTRTQLLQRLFDNLTRGESDQALREIERLRALTDPSPFYRQIEEHEQIRQQLADAIQAMHNGQPDKALPRLRRLNQRFPATEAVDEAFRNCQALTALQTTVRDLPASWAEQQQAALASLKPNRDTLAATETFQKWYAEQKKHLARKKQSEHTEAQRQLRSELDLALISHRAAAPLVLAQLAATNTDIRNTLEKRARHSAPFLSPSDNLLPLEAALCLTGSGNPADVSESKPSRARSPWRSRQLLAALDSARSGEWSPAFRQLNEIHLESPLDSHYSTVILTTFFPDGANGFRPPQVSPCPSVSELLQAIADIAR